MSNESLPILIQQMLKPEFYPHSVTTIELMQTHVSYVLLTGNFVYKIKKPVNFGFLDYSTLELRHHFCQEEIRLNQRGAAQLYLEVLPITQVGETYQLSGNGEVVEYVLKMVQFPQETLLSNMFAAGTLTNQQMIDMGKVVADFHKKADTNDYIKSFGEIPKIRASIDENYQQTSKYIGKAQTQQHFEETKEYTDRFFVEHEVVFEHRKNGNFIKECHGDLHARNICYWQDQLLLFDCIEFNEPFRFVDTMYDVAFAVMDLDSKGRSDLGNTFLNTYLEETGDWSGLEVLPLYLSRQAYVRAKVTSFLLDDPAIPEPVKIDAQKTASDYYQLAWQYTQKKSGKIIMMSGLSGSGKSTTAKEIATSQNAIYIRSDAVRKHLGGIALNQRGDDSLYTPEMTAKTYEKLLNLGLILAQSGYTVILDAKYDRIALRQPVITACKNQQIPLEIVFCNPPESVIRDRLIQRSGDIADATVDLLTSQQQNWEDFTTEEQSLVTTKTI